MILTITQGRYTVKGYLCEKDLETCEKKCGDRHDCDVRIHVVISVIAISIDL